MNDRRIGFRPGLSAAVVVGWSIAGVLAATPPAIAAGCTADRLPPRRAERSALVQGDVGDDVKELQALLILLGFQRGQPTGQFDRSTLEAVQGFQQVVGLPPSGTVDRATWERLLPPADPAIVPCL